MKLYNKEGLKPENLKWIGFSGKWIAVFGTELQNGMAFNFTGEHEFYGPVDPSPLSKLRIFIGRSLTSLADYLVEKKGILFEALFLAVLNALSSPLNDEERLKKNCFSLLKINDFDFVKEDDFVTVIGAGFIVNQLRQSCREVHVSDMRRTSTLESLFVGKKTIKGPKGIMFHSFEDNEDLLSESDIVFMTGCTLTNQTIFKLLPMIKKARMIGIYGPSAMLLSDYLLGLGVNYITSSRIVNPLLLRQYLFEGFYGKKFDECLERYSIAKF